MDELKIEALISAEAKRLSDKYNKDYLDCADIIKITGLGRDNVRDLMSRKDFPIMKVGKRKIVSVVAFATWQIKNMRS
ncbi:MAG: hypothetical protein WCR54_08180 [Clostridia bacterium]